MPPIDLLAALQLVLQKAPEGFSLDTVCARLKVETGRNYPPLSVERNLRAHPDRFFEAKQGENIWRCYRQVLLERAEKEQAEPAVRPTFFLASAERFVVFDLETTGTSPLEDRPVEIAAVRYSGEREIDRFQTLVDPRFPLPPAVMRLTGITPDELAGAPPLSEALPRFLEFLGEDPVVGHNISRFDLPMLANCAKELGITWVERPVIDTLEMALLILPRLPRHTLESLGEHFALLDSGEDLHRATADVELTTRIFAALRSETKNEPSLHAILKGLLPAHEWPALAFLQAPTSIITLRSALATMKPNFLPPRVTRRDERVDEKTVCTAIAQGGARRKPQERPLPQGNPFWWKPPPARAKPGLISTPPSRWPVPRAAAPSSRPTPASSRTRC
jgi:DNA polymerase III epsilon subunit family exonuclease